MKVKSLLITTALGLILAAPAMADKMTVADVNKNMAKLGGKQVTITGKVVKVNNGIMRRNFVHVQEGGEKVIVTSKQTAQVGQTVTVTGTVALDTDFGMGYSYPLLVEKSSIQINK